MTLELVLGIVVAALAATSVGLVLVQRRAGRRAERLRAELAVARTATDGARGEVARLLAALDASSEGVLVLDADDRLAACNAAARALVDCDLALGRPLAEVLPWPMLHAAITTCRATARPSTFELDGLAAGGRVLAVHVQTIPGVGTMIGIDDHSRLRRLESLRRDFVANVSHELKTPLAAIQGFVETLQDEPEMVPATRQRFLERIAVQTSRLSTLVADLLTLSRLDDDLTVRQAPGPCDFSAVLRDTVRDLLPLAERRSLQLVPRLPEPPAFVAADPEALRQVAGNLVDNAIKYTPPGGRVDVVLQPAGSRFRLEVRDTGIGLSPADQERVFERFYRVDRARSRELGGTGLGLSIVKNTVKTLGGDIGVASELGKGSTFWVELPAAAVGNGADDDDRVTG